MKRVAFNVTLIVFFLIASSRAFAYKLTIVSPGISGNSRAYIQSLGKDSKIEPVEGRFEFTGSTEPKVDAVLIDYEGDGEFIPFFIYLSEEEIKVELSGTRAGGLSFKISDGKNAMGYWYDLQEQVNNWNEKIDFLRNEMEAAKKKISSDSAVIQEKIKTAVFNCFAVPQKFIKDNPGSPVSIRALQMMGKGGGLSPVTIKDLERLFLSLDEKIRNSPNGIAYKKFLEDTKIQNQDKQ